MKSETPKDIKLIVATKTEALWMKVRDNLKDRINSYEDELIVAKEQLKGALRIIQEERKQ